MRSPILALLALLALGAAGVACERPPPATRGVPPAARAAVERWLAGETPDGAPAGARPPDGRGFRALGAEVYRLRCIPCHGVNGNGKGIHAARLSVPARDFTKGVYEFRSTPSGELPTDEDLFRSVSRGVHGTAMIPWSWLPEPERWAVLEHVKGFSPRFRDEGPGEPVAVPETPAETPELVAPGRGGLAAERMRQVPRRGGRGRRALGLHAPARRREAHPAHAVLRRALPARRLARTTSISRWPPASTGRPCRRTRPSLRRSSGRWPPWVRVRAGLPGAGSRPLPPDAEEQMGWRIDVEDR